MSTFPQPDDPESIRTDHRDLDGLFGRFLEAASAGSLAAAVEAIGVFDDALRFHTRMEESLFPPGQAEKLVAAPGETPADALFRELRLEHVQIRELSGMIRRVLGESADLSAARALAGSLAQRWDAHTAREEREWLGPLSS
ncbi:MAG TPA: hemerythrin domain-containing protein [Thermoanaerobaculia bacterium]|nr:hemerythrin domain-containing protein [Thermoanaerobaculia bacterium]